MYRLDFRRKALKDIKKIHPIDQRRIIEALERLEKNPFSNSLDIKKLARSKDSWRIRAGSARAIYKLNTRNKKIYVWEVGYRGGFY